MDLDRQRSVLYLSRSMGDFNGRWVGWENQEKKMTAILQWCNANQGFISAVLTLIYVVTTMGLACFAWHSNKLAQTNIQTLKHLEENRVRPFVLFEMYSEAPFICLRVSNRGHTSAHNISFAIDPSLKILMGGENAVPREKSERSIRFLENGIKFMAPGQIISTVIGSSARVKEVYPERLFQGTVSYSTPNGTKFQDEIVVDLRYLADSFHVSKKTIHEVGNELEEIKRILNLLATGFHKPFVITQDVEDRRADEKRYREQSQPESTEAHSVEEG